jgi:hypothetical protein
MKDEQSLIFRYENKWVVYCKICRKRLKSENLWRHKIAANHQKKLAAFENKDKVKCNIYNRSILQKNIRQVILRNK